MTESEKIFETFAKKNMIQWNQSNFKKHYPKLFKTIIESIDSALKSTK